MKQIKLAAAALNQTPLAWASNVANIIAAIEAARDEGVSILCLPELCITGYGCEDAFHAPHVTATAHALLAEIIPSTNDIIVAIGAPIFHRGGLYNAAALVCDQRLLGFTCKQNLAGDGIHYEPRWFRRWSAGALGEIMFAGESVPIGDVLYECGGIRIGFEICEDAWVADRPGGRLASRGVDVLLNPSASHFAFGKQQIRERFVLEGSRAFHVSYAYANLLGNESGRAIFDGGSLIASGGQMLARANRFSYADWTLISAVVDVDATRSSRARSATDPDEAQSLPGICVTAPFSISTQVGSPKSATNSTKDDADSLSLDSDLFQSKEEEFSQAVPLALFDYLRKSRARGFVVSLSGGADSSAVALLIALAIRFGTRELGIAGFLAKLAGESPQTGARGDEASDEICSDRDLVERLLTCVYQSTRNSTDTTYDAARTIAATIGATFLSLDVDEIVEDYKSIVSDAVGRSLGWEADDLALQNIQARARGPSAWLIANISGALLLTTSNRSEAAVGYATMDGDTCGGLAPIAGIDKAFLRRWLRWMETVGPSGVGATPELAVVNRQQPTAELRPADAHQTDEDDLMPYEVLDAIERAAIRDKLSPLEVFQTIRSNFANSPPRQLCEWVERFFTLWCRNQWKRERYAPSFHLDDENLDPKTWCRFPILSGGYERELEELRAFVAECAAE